MLNKKGTSLVELIISIALISVVLVFMIKLLVDINNTETNSTYAEDNQLKRAEIIKTIENDLLDKKIKNIESEGALEITFTFDNGKTSVINVEEKKLSYTDSLGDKTSWSLSDNATYDVEKANVDYQVDESDGEYYSLVIDIEVHTNNDKNSDENNNILDDILISYVGKKIDDSMNDLNCLGEKC